MTETNDCIHGYAAHERRYCVHCTYADEIADRDAEIKRLMSELDDERSMLEAVKFDFETVESQLDDVVERSLKYKEALYRIQNATMSTFISAEGMTRYMKRTAKGALNRVESTEAAEN